jgi:hypothetical protein
MQSPTSDQLAWREHDGVRLNGITIHLKQDIARVLYGVLAAYVFLYAIFYFLPYKYVSFLYRILAACVFLYVVFYFFPYKVYKLSLD